MSGLGHKVVKGAFWVFLTRFSTQFVSFFVTLVLARLLTPSDYGTVALLTIFTSVAGIIVDSGMGMALVQKKDATDLDFNSLFYASIALASTAYLILWIAAPWVADFYQVRDLKWMLRLISVSLIFSAMNSVQGAELSRKMLFHLSFRISLITCFTSAIAGISLAYAGYGPWAIAWQGVITGIVGVVANWFIIAWRPKLMFSFKALKGLFDFGWKVSLVSVISTVYKDAYALIIGKSYSKEDLAFVNKGHATPNLAIGTISSTICGVSFPALAQMQDDRARVKNAVRRMILSASFFVFPLMVGVGVCADDLVLVLFGAKWLPCVPYMRLACFALSLQPFHDINLQTIAAFGRGDVFLKLQIIKTGIGCLFMFIFLRFSVLAFMAALSLISGPISLYVNAYYNKQFIGYSFFAQIRDVLPTSANSLAMGAVVWLVGFLIGGDNTFARSLVRLTAMVMTGVILYFVLSFVFKNKGFVEYLKISLPKVEARFPSLARKINQWMF